jgi:hypothetical protein
MQSQTLPNLARRRSEDSKRERRLPAGKTEAAMCPGHYRQEAAEKGKAWGFEFRSRDSGKEKSRND